MPALELAAASSAGIGIAVLLSSEDEQDFASIMTACRTLRSAPDGGPVILAMAITPEHVEALCDEGVDDFMLWPNDERLVASRVGLLFRRVAQRKKDAVRAAMLGDALRHAERSEQRFRHLAESSTEILARFSPGGVRLYISPACRTVLGYEPDELLGSSILDILHPSDVSKLLEALGALDAGAQVAGAIIRLQRKDGEYAWLETISRPVRDPRTDVIEEFVTVSRDITAMIHAEHEKLEAEARIAVIDAIPDPLSVEDDTGRFTIANRAFCALLGRSREEVLGQSADALKPAPKGTGPDRWPQTTDEREVTIKAPDGSLRVLVEKRALLAVRKEERQLVSILRDITEHRQREAEARLATAAALSAGIAHELNNPLSFLIGNIGFVSEALGASKSEDVTKALDEAALGAKRMASLVRDMRILGEASRETPPKTNMKRAVEAALMLTTGAIAARARLSSEVADVPFVAGEPAGIALLLVDLLLRTARALPEGDPKANEVRVVLAPASGGMVSFEVFGSGRSADRAGEAGLSRSESFVSAYGGRIDVENVPGKGTRLRLFLPVAP
ncbi:PAS domain-containing protein [Polyangium jinanense]|uniref:histidine kinase n=1 Tax=Polyangium jinanense TaxID=2829994 RepID=A0A9X3XHD5_9BACT|nr:PAS domain S-box protein [Polyangium jinanense]MDC3962673.1 PAS domain-containing sensor histidine kinase [Polyangium jinanense]MDC3989395.1 PAS domain-containing sensor histidine kinase [Polyangium jinanense]